MKITVIGAGGTRTPLAMQSILASQEHIGLTELALMDTNAENLELMRILCESLLEDGDARFSRLWTTDARQALTGADYVVTTFRAGGMASRVVDEQVPLRYGVLGQETTGPGGFAMAMRTIPAILNYVTLVRQVAPRAWIVNFTNPAGIIIEAIVNQAGFERAVGICDNPSSMHRAIAVFLGARSEEVFLEYFGLNHLGWVRAVYHKGADVLPELIAGLRGLGQELPGLPFAPGFIEALGMLPNEYLYFYYRNREAVDNLLKAGQSRAQQILPLNRQLYDELRRIRDQGGEPEQMMAAYTNYLRQRNESRMSIETGSRQELPPELKATDAAEGYAGVALGTIEGLAGQRAGVQVLNVPSRGAIVGMEEEDVVEVTCYVADSLIRPFAIGTVPDHALGLMKRVKAYERLTVEAAVTGSYATALKALALHPLVPDYGTAKCILDDYVESHGDLFPTLV